MLKFREIGTFKNAVNIGYMTADVVLHNGMIVEYDRETEKCALPTDPQGSGLAIVMNNCDKPEIYSPNDYVIEIGENPRLFTLKSLEDRILDMDMDQINGDYADIEAGKFLVANTEGTLDIVASASGYDECFKIIGKTGFNGEGVAVVVVIA